MTLTRSSSVIAFLKLDTSAFNLAVLSFNLLLVLSKLLYFALWVQPLQLCSVERSVSADLLTPQLSIAEAADVLAL